MDSGSLYEVITTEAENAVAFSRRSDHHQWRMLDNEDINKTQKSLHCWMKTKCRKEMVRSAGGGGR